MKNVILLSVLILTSSCATLTGQDNSFPEGFSVVQNGPEIWDVQGKIKIEYKTHKELTAEQEKKIKNEMLGEKEAKEALEWLPLGGLVYVHIFRSTIDIANTSNFTYIVQKNGKEVYREDGKMSVPLTPSHYGFDGNWWRNTDIIPLSNFDKNDEIKVFVIDKFHAKRDEFTIKHKDKAF